MLLTFAVSALFVAAPAVADAHPMRTLANYGNYVYKGPDYAAEGVKLYAVDKRTGKKRFMATGVGTVQCKAGRVLTTTNMGDVEIFPVYIFKANGSGRKKIADAAGARLTKKWVYYAKCDSRQTLFKAYRCKRNGKSKKAVTCWVSSAKAR